VIDSPLENGDVTAKSGTRARNLFDPSSPEPYRLSRSKLELFLHCPRCFYLDRRLGVGRPDAISMSLNNAVDLLLKKEFDLYRARGEPHPCMTGINALPLRHPALDEWRDSWRGLRALHEPTNLLVHGAVDDLWVEPSGSIIVTDYKATSSERQPSLGGRWGGGYKRQVEVYQWLLRQMGFPVSKTAYFVYVNGDRSREGFEGKLAFTTTVIPYIGNDDWVDDALREAKLCLNRDTPPAANPECEWCAYRKAASGVEG
jgi:hypothetical protein